MDENDANGTSEMMEDKKMNMLGIDAPFDAVILANGDYPTHEIPLAILSTASRLVCCDGAAHALHGDIASVEAVVGDGDSLTSEDKARLGASFHPVAEQDYNDLTKATRYLLEHGCGPRIAYLGTTGKREDHTLGNISLMTYYAREMGVQPTLITDHGYFVVGKGEETFVTRCGQQVSLFNINCKQLSSKGLRWEAYPFEMFWQGTLNEALGENITLRGDGYYMVFRNFI